MHRFVVCICIGLVELTAPRPLLAAPAAALAPTARIIVATLSPIARIHGKIVSIDRTRGTFLIHHDPFAQMPMAMTMLVEPRRRSDLRALQVGDIISVTIDTSVYPWPGSDIRPAPRMRAGVR